MFINVGYCTVVDRDHVSLLVYKINGFILLLVTTCSSSSVRVIYLAVCWRCQLIQPNLQKLCFVDRCYHIWGQAGTVRWLLKNDGWVSKIMYASKAVLLSEYSEYIQRIVGFGFAYNIVHSRVESHVTGFEN